MTRANSLLAELYQEGRRMAGAPQQIKIGSRLSAALNRAITAANAAASTLENEVTGLENDLGAVHDVAADVKATRQQIAVALTGNGGPATEDPPAPQTSPQAPTKLPPAPQLLPGQVMFQGVPMDGSKLAAAGLSTDPNASAAPAPASSEPSSSQVDTDAIRRQRQGDSSHQAGPTK